MLCLSDHLRPKQRLRPAAMPQLGRHRGAARRGAHPSLDAAIHVTGQTPGGRKLEIETNVETFDRLCYEPLRSRMTKVTASRSRAPAPARPGRCAPGATMFDRRWFQDLGQSDYD